MPSGFVIACSIWPAPHVSSSSALHLTRHNMCSEDVSNAHVPGLDLQPFCIPSCEQCGPMRVSHLQIGCPYLKVCEATPKIGHDHVA